MDRNTVNDIVGFHLVTDPHGCFSNWCHSDFIYAGIRYNCMEQYMMAQKVALGHRADLRQKIMETDDPAKIKELAGKNSFPEFNDIKQFWDKHCRHIVKRGVKAKFRQNPDMLRELLDTGRALLCECARQDKIWGIGININDPSWHDVANWNGNNYLGIVLMEVREELRKELSEKGSVQYQDFVCSSPIPEWDMTIGRLKRFPQYYAAIHTYADQLESNDIKYTFYCCTFGEIEEMMRTNMGGGFPVAGFYETKQEIYEIAVRLDVDK